jgi:hypothetical protein
MSFRISCHFSCMQNCARIVSTYARNIGTVATHGHLTSRDRNRIPLTKKLASTSFDCPKYP